MEAWLHLEFSLCLSTEKLFTPDLLSAVGITKGANRQRLCKPLALLPHSIPHKERCIEGLNHLRKEAINLNFGSRFLSISGPKLPITMQMVTAIRNSEIQILRARARECLCLPPAQNKYLKMLLNRRQHNPVY